MILLQIHFDWAILIILIPLVGGGFSLYKLVTLANKFFRRADEIETWIRTNEPQEKVVGAIFTLKRIAFIVKLEADLRNWLKWLR